MDGRAVNIVHNLKAFAGERQAGLERAISFKLRPAAEKTGFNDRYVSSSEYDEMIAAFGFAPDSTIGLIGGRSFKIPNGIVLVEHETGPEILAVIAHVGEAVGPYLAFAELVRNVVKVALWLRKKVKENSERQPSDRHYHDARLIRMEMRTTKRDGDLVEETVAILDFASPVSERSLSKEVLEKMERAVQSPQA